MKCFITIRTESDGKRVENYRKFLLTEADELGSLGEYMWNVASSDNTEVAFSSTADAVAALERVLATIQSDLSKVTKKEVVKNDEG